MLLVRYIIILLIFFGTLFYFREPIRDLPEKFSGLESSYAQSFKGIFKDIINASSTSLFDKLPKNFIPTSSSSSSKDSNQDGINNTDDQSVLGDFEDKNKSQTNTPSNADANTSVNTGTNTNNNPYNRDGTLKPVTSNQPENTLSAQGIIFHTNQSRASAGLGYLAQNDTLTRSAESKLQDMFKNQYFEHVSPNGESVSDGAKRYGYDFIVVGENLAMGVFGGDDQVVLAWMASPGHKKNILDKRFMDVGVAVGLGVYQGRRQWIVVQQFGKPLSSCNAPNLSSKDHIENLKSDLVVLEDMITKKHADIQTQTGEQYNQSAIEYNILVNDYNVKLNEIKNSIELYNESVRGFNQCAGLR
jgi:uncharacterized protein YkwD